MIRSSHEHCSRCLTRLRGMVRLPKDALAADMDAQLIDYARELTQFEAEDVERVVLGWARRSKWWPALAELVDAAKTEQTARENRARFRSLPPPADFWDAPWQQLGIGLQIARGQCILEELNAEIARHRFNDRVGRLGLDRAKRLADAAYSPGGDHACILRALEAELEPRAA